MPLYNEEPPYFADVTKELIICYEGVPYKVISDTLGSVMMNNMAGQETGYLLCFWQLFVYVHKTSFITWKALQMQGFL